MTKRYMLDTVADPATGNVPGLPGSVKLGGQTVPVTLEAGYVNGRYAWKSRQPDVWIDVNGLDPRAHVLDCETGDATPAQTPPWAKAHNGLHTEFPAVIYANRSTLTSVFDAMGQAGMHVVKDFYLWIATLDGTEAVADMTGVVAVQAYGAKALGFNADLSVVYDDAFPRAPVTPPPGRGPYRHVAPRVDGESLGKYAEDRRTTVGHILSVSEPELTAEHLAVLKAYITLEDAMTAAGMTRPVMPTGLVFWTENK